METHVVGEDGGAVLKGSFVSDDYAILSLMKEQWISDIYCCILTNILRGIGFKPNLVIYPLSTAFV